MSLVDGIRYRLRTLLQRGRTEAEREAEVRFHLTLGEMHEGGSDRSAIAARSAARRRFGNVTSHRQALRAQSRFSWIDSAFREIRFALRGLRRGPGYWSAMVVTQSLGIAAVAGIGAMGYGVVLRPLPFPEAERLVAVEHEMPGFGQSPSGVSMSEGLYLEYRRAGIFDAIGLYGENDGVALTDRDDPVRLRVAVVTPSLLLMLGVKPAAGRLFTAAESEPGAPALVTISYALWVGRYGGDSSLIGRPIELNRKLFQVVGVMPKGFDFPSPNTSVWYNQTVDPAQSSLLGLQYKGLARLRSGRSIDETEAAMAAAIAGSEGRYADATASLIREARIRPLVTELDAALVRDVREPLALLFVTGLVILLISWANAANLVLVRAEGQRGEVALGRALGATSWGGAGRIVAELGLLATLAGGLGLAVAAWLVAIHFGFDPEQIPRSWNVRPDLRLAGFVVVLAVGFFVTLSMVGMARLSGERVLGALAGSSIRATDDRRLRRAQRSMVAVQLALAGTVLVTAAMMVRTIGRLSAAQLGFESRDQVTLQLDLPYWPYPSYLAGARFYGALLDRLRAVPGVLGAEAVAAPPLAGANAIASFRMRVEALGEPAPRADAMPMAVANLVTPGYFRALAIPLESGRAFASGDLGSGAPNVILSARLARVLFAGRDPIGRWVRLPQGPAASPWHLVVGVVGDVPGTTIPEGPAPSLYFPVLDDPARARDAPIDAPIYPGYMTLVVRTPRTAADLLPRLREAVREVDPKVPVARVGSLDEAVSESMARLRLTMRLLVVAAAAALVLGVVGVYGVIAFVVSRRTRELGLRMAVGATPARLVAMVVGQGIAGSLAGVFAGLVGGWISARFLRSFLFEVSPSDPVSFTVIAVVLVGATALASYVPARRASRIDPVTVLKD